jgi:hypothetical protein
MHTVPAINIVRIAATATAILNPGKRRYQAWPASLIPGKKSGTKAGKTLPDGNVSQGISNLNGYQQVALKRNSTLDKPTRQSPICVISLPDQLLLMSKNEI